MEVRGKLWKCGRSYGGEVGAVEVRWVLQRCGGKWGVVETGRCCGDEVGAAEVYSQQ